MMIVLGGDTFEVVCDSLHRATWLDARRDGIGSSDSATVLRLNPWSSETELYATKLGLTVEDDEQSEAAYWGSMLEDLVLEEFNRRSDRNAVPWQTLLRSKARPWQLATCDGIQKTERGHGVVEVKCTSLYHRWDEGVPPYVYCQVQHQLAVTGFDYASVAVLWNGRRFDWCDVDRNEEFIEELNDTERLFWGRLQNGEPPEPDGKPCTSKAIAALYPKSNGESKALEDGSFLTLDEKRSDLAERIANLTEEKRELDNKLKHAIGDAEMGVLRNGVVYTLKSDKRGVRSLRRKEAQR